MRRRFENRLWSILACILAEQGCGENGSQWQWNSFWLHFFYLIRIILVQLLLFWLKCTYRWFSAVFWCYSSLSITNCHIFIGHRQLSNQNVKKIKSGGAGFHVRLQCAQSYHDACHFFVCLIFSFQINQLHTERTHSHSI